MIIYTLDYSIYNCTTVVYEKDLGSPNTVFLPPPCLTSTEATDLSQPQTALKIGFPKGYIGLTPTQRASCDVNLFFGIKT